MPRESSLCVAFSSDGCRLATGGAGMRLTPVKTPTCSAVAEQNSGMVDHAFGIGRQQCAQRGQ
jgi:hypothetical protein